MLSHLSAVFTLLKRYPAHWHHPVRETHSETLLHSARSYKEEFMLVTTKELLCIANAENKAIGAFNITGLETLQAVLQAAESKKEPVILQFAQVHEEEHIMSLDIIGPIMIMMADQATVPVAVHLDHGVIFIFSRKLWIWASPLSCMTAPPCPMEKISHIREWLSVWQRSMVPVWRRKSVRWLV